LSAGLFGESMAITRHMRIDSFDRGKRISFEPLDKIGGIRVVASREHDSHRGSKRLPFSFDHRHQSRHTISMANHFNDRGVASYSAATCQHLGLQGGNVRFRVWNDVVHPRATVWRFR